MKIILFIVLLLVFDLPLLIYVGCLEKHEKEKHEKEEHEKEGD